jgi:hypothetical protein
VGSEGRRVFGVDKVIQKFKPLLPAAFDGTTQSHTTELFADGVGGVEFTVAFEASQQGLACQ